MECRLYKVWVRIQEAVRRGELPQECLAILQALPGVADALVGVSGQQDTVQSLAQKLAEEVLLRARQLKAAVDLLSRGHRRQIGARGALMPQLRID